MGHTIFYAILHTKHMDSINPNVCYLPKGWQVCERIKLHVNLMIYCVYHTLSVLFFRTKTDDAYNILMNRVYGNLKIKLK